MSGLADASVHNSLCACTHKTRIATSRQVAARIPGCSWRALLCAEVGGVQQSAGLALQTACMPARGPFYEGWPRPGRHAHAHGHGLALHAYAALRAAHIPFLRGVGCCLVAAGPALHALAASTAACVLCASASCKPVSRACSVRASCCLLRPWPAPLPRTMQRLCRSCR